MTTPPPLFGRDEALNMLGGDEGLLADVVNIAREELPRQIASFKTALDAEDAPTARRHAHTLKGTVATLGASQVKDSAFEAECAARDGSLASARQIYLTLDELVRRLVSELDAYASRRLTAG
ncbi:MAG: Hpt domain-containing protein [Burkholderiales bacterium]